MSNLDDKLNMRINGEVKKQFVEHCEIGLNRPWAEVLREMITALTEGRLHITLPENNRTKDLYR